MKIPIKVVFSNRDEILGAIIRALAVQVAGFQMGRGMDGLYLRQNGYYRFEFANQTQVDRFTESVTAYLQDRWRNTIQIMPDSNQDTTAPPKKRGRSANKNTKFGV
jgi:hypothetical protein